MSKRIPFNLEIPKDVWDLKKLFTDNDRKLFVVGGAVRDALTNKHIKDYDLSTDATPDEMRGFIPQSSSDNKGSKNKYTIIEAGNIFPVVHLMTPDKGRYEIATFRVDMGDNHRKPETRFATIEEDVKRRDLTMNALFYDLDTKEIVDLVGGIDDILNKRVRTVGEPSKRFEENQIRKLRAIRFTSRVGSNLDKAIEKSFAKNNSLDEEAQEAITEEFIKGVLQSQDTPEYLNMIFKFGFDEWIFKGIGAKPESIVDTKDISLIIASMARKMNGSNLRSHLKSVLKYPDTVAKRASFFVKFQSFSEDKLQELWKLNKDSAKITEGEMKKAALLFESYNISEIEAFFKFSPQANSEDLMKLGFKGKALGDEIKRINVEHFKTLL